MAVEGEAADYTRSILQIPELVSEELEQQTRMAAADLDNDLMPDLRRLHLGALRLVATERRLERQTAWKQAQQASPDITPAERHDWLAQWHESWQLTPERREHVMRKYPLAVRLAGRGVMKLINNQRFGPRGMLRGNKGQTQLVAFAELIEGRPESPEDIRAHLKRAGYAHRARLPADARRYLEIYPPPQQPGPDEKNRRTMTQEFDVSDNLLIRIIAENSLYPVVRIFAGKGGRESEFFTASDVAFIQRAIHNLPPINAEEEITVAAALREVGCGEALEVRVVNHADIPTFDRRLAQGRGRAMRREYLPRLQKTFDYLTTPQPGEMGLQGLADALGLSKSRIRGLIIDEDYQYSRPLFNSGGDSRLVFSPDRVQVIMERIRHPPLPPYLITGNAITARLRGHASLHIKRKLREHPDPAVQIDVRQRHSSDLLCFTWRAFQDIERRFPPDDNADPIQWERLPTGPWDLDPDKITYARTVQTRYAGLVQVDDTPVQEYIDRQLAAWQAMREKDPSLPELPPATPYAPPTLDIFTLWPTPHTPAPSGRAHQGRRRSRRPTITAPPEGITPPVPTPDSEAEPTVEVYTPSLPYIPVHQAFPAGERPYGNYGPVRAMNAAPPPAPAPPETVARPSYSEPEPQPLPPPVIPRLSITLHPWQPRGRGKGSEALTSSSTAGPEAIGRHTGASIADVRAAIAATDLRDCLPPERRTVGGRVEMHYRGKALQRIVDTIVGVNEQLLVRRTGFTPAGIRRILTNQGIDIPAPDERYSPQVAGFLERLRRPHILRPLREILERADMDEAKAVQFLRRNYGRIGTFYSKEGEPGYYVEPGSAELLIRQRYPTGEDPHGHVPRADYNWLHRRQIVAISGRPINDFEAWLRERPTHPQWMESVDGEILLHYSRDFLQSYLHRPRR